jgi:hypothetical protein
VGWPRLGVWIGHQQDLRVRWVERPKNLKYFFAKRVIYDRNKMILKVRLMQAFLNDSQA